MAEDQAKVRMWVAVSIKELRELRDSTKLFKWYDLFAVSDPTIAVELAAKQDEGVAVDFYWIQKNWRHAVTHGISPEQSPSQEELEAFSLKNRVKRLMNPE